MVKCWKIVCKWKHVLFRGVINIIKNTLYTKIYTKIQQKKRNSNTKNKKFFFLTKIVLKEMFGVWKKKLKTVK